MCPALSARCQDPLHVEDAGDLGVGETGELTHHLDQRGVGLGADGRHPLLDAELCVRSALPVDGELEELLVGLTADDNLEDRREQQALLPPGVGPGDRSTPWRSSPRAH
jgi:hypothetical protein